MRERAELTSPEGSIAVAVAALLLVLGFRLARPGAGWACGSRSPLTPRLARRSFSVHVASSSGARFAAGGALRVAGAALLVLGRSPRRHLLSSGTPLIERTAARQRPRALGTGPHPAVDLVYAGLAVVLVGQLAREPSFAGAMSTLAAVALCTYVALAPRRTPLRDAAR